MAKKELVLKSLRKLTEDEVREIVKISWSDEHMIDYITKSYDYYVTQDGYHIEVEKPNHFSIYKTMWYDDEIDGPSVTLENFIHYNIRNFQDYSIENYEKQKENMRNGMCGLGNYDYDGMFLECNNSIDKKWVEPNCLKDWQGLRKNIFVRYMTPDEQEDFYKIIKADKEYYINRLTKYFNRYRDKIWAEGYWVNR